MSTTSPSGNTLGSTSTEREQRREERFPLPVDVEIQSAKMFPGFPDLGVLRDISESGVGLEHDRPMEIGEIVDCKILDAPTDGPCAYQVEILWQTVRENGTYLSGGRIVSAQS